PACYAAWRCASTRSRPGQAKANQPRGAVAKSPSAARRQRRLTAAPLGYVLWRRSGGTTCCNMRIDYVLKRVGMVFVLIWVAATLNFIGPRLTGKDPVKTRLLKQAVVGGYVQQGMDEMAKEYERKFVLDKPL